MIEWIFVGVFVFFLLLTLTGFGFALPEEVTLLLAGVYAALTELWWSLLVACVLGVLTADTLAYARGRRHSVQFSRFKKGAKFITQNGFLAVVLSRVFISTRVVVPYMAGALKMPKMRFHFASLLGAVVSVLVLVSIGRWLYSALPASAAPVVAAIVLCALTAYLVRSGAKAHLHLLEGMKE